MYFNSMYESYNPEVRLCVLVFVFCCFMSSSQWIHSLYNGLSAWAKFFFFPKSSENADVSSGAGGRETLGDEPGRIGRRSM